ncbi:uncharacterized protein LOC116182177 [Photinus pyralis]|uniref:uncharacterized protein LOC116164951 n=1 Tax=Photinus pyralis TaxID=7054 RepID=UPI00126731E4|nr:uncharacterized protein LOC116164951 [Photinus pyralis]XP_031358554.1 uncharacterized protein LOC116182177 [Photinus pyralis]
MENTSAEQIKAETKTEVQQQIVAASRPLIPPCGGTRPDVWFAIVEANFNLANPKIIREETKYSYVLSALTPDLANELADVMIDPHPTEPYTKLKAAILKRTCLSETQKIKQLLSGQELGNKKPTQLLRQMRSLVANTTYVNEQ